MDTPAFLKLADSCLDRVAAWLEDFDPDELDFTPSDGVLTLEFADRARYVLNRQTAAHQVWFAAGARAWHFVWDAERGAWFSDKDGEELYALVADAVSRKLGRPRGAAAVMIQLARLEGFYWVARTGGYASAARAFPYPITQPAVHQQVKKLEAELGVALFERVAKDKMKPTPAGEHLYRFVAPFFTGLPGVLRAVSEGEYGGELHLSAAALSLRSLLPGWIKRVHKAHPGIRVHMTEAPSPDLGGLRRGEMDLVVDYFPEVPDDCASLVVGVMRPFLVLPRAHALARRKHVELADCAEETFIAYTPGLIAHELQLRALALAGVTPPHMLSASAAESILAFVEAGLGYSLIPSFEAAGPRSRGVAAFPLKSPKVAYPVSAVWRKDTPENPLLDALLEAAPSV